VAQSNRPETRREITVPARMSSDTLKRIVVCPACWAALDAEPDALSCAACQVIYPVTAGQPDLRPRRMVERSLSFQIAPLTPDPSGRCAPLPAGPWPPVRYPRNGAFQGGNRLSRTLSTHLPPAGPNDVLFDLGCGDTQVGAHLARQRGYEYVGGDIYGRDASALVDAHALPFASESIAACCTFAVLEHVRVPQLVAAELRRVLRPGGVLIGSVAFLEPYHAGSHFHHTHLGTHEALSVAGFEQIQVEANADWRASDALYGMYTARGIPFGRYLRPLFRPTLRLLTRSTRWTTRRQPDELLLMTAGYRFVARRPG
jgi:SAM-dependent methyltransferase